MFVYFTNSLPPVALCFPTKATSHWQWLRTMIFYSRHFPGKFPNCPLLHLRKYKFESQLLINWSYQIQPFEKDDRYHAIQTTPPSMKTWLIWMNSLLVDKVASRSLFCDTWTPSDDDWASSSVGGNWTRFTLLIFRLSLLLQLPVVQRP